ncbi:MAG: hypothetical protein AVDCRST_MAG64-1648 [uncultured Phycisphaerae bacterium]|uniref:Uncharacterized protein n=1 Tax=uncultured Phycisphaerae bacterium TaxID=904963 RepID=A0A6J4NYA4_9BACT|nr:MAG: hypothetical protein AVDCRST_MAG64-1648 [uncultured Phycisphaerae bacterium]
MTSNTDAVAEGIQSLAQNEAVAATLSRIISRDRIAASREAAGELERATTDARSTAAAGDRLLLGLPEAPAQPQAQQALLDYANRLIVYLGDQPVDTLDKAATWLTDNRARLRARYLEE